MKEIQANKNISENLKYYMDLNKINNRELGEKIGVSESTVGKWLLMKSTPRMVTIEKLANLFGIKKSDLLEDHSDTPQGLKPKVESYLVPVFSSVSCENPLVSEENIVDYEGLPLKWKVLGEFYGIKCKGASMEPRFKDGDVVIVKKQSHFENGDISIVLINGDESTMKIVKSSDQGITLIATNLSVYDPHFYTKDEIESLPLRIIGKVVELRAKF